MTGVLIAGKKAGRPIGRTPMGIVTGTIGGPLHASLETV
jgi:hypothetical protein